MVEQVGYLGDDPIVPLSLGGQDDLHRLLADFLEDLVFACAQQSGRVGAGPGIGLAVEHRGKECVENVAQVRLHLADAQHAVVKQGRGPGRVRLALGEHLGKVLQAPGPAAGDDRHRDRPGDGAGQRHVVAGQRAVGVHARHQHLSGSQFDRPYRLLDCIDPGRRAPAVDVDLPAVLGMKLDAV